MNTMELYHSGRMSEAASALQMPVMTVESMCNAVLRCARDAELKGYSREDVHHAIARLERAIGTLREAAAMSEPKLRLVAAE